MEKNMLDEIARLYIDNLLNELDKYKNECRLLEKKLAERQEQLFDKDIELYKTKYSYNYQRILEDSLRSNALVIDKYYFKEFQPLIKKYGYEMVERNILKCQLVSDTYTKSNE